MKEHACRLGDKDVGVHGSQNSHDLHLDLGVRKRLDTLTFVPLVDAAKAGQHSGSPSRRGDEIGAR